MVVESLFDSKSNQKIAFYQMVALFRNSAYSFSMQPQFQVSASALISSLFFGLLLSLFLLR
jgi:hypothetical protein